MNSGADALISSASAYMTAQGPIDVLIRRLRFFAQQGNCSHHLSGLTITALRNGVVLPRGDDYFRCQVTVYKAFDGREISSFGRLEWKRAGASGPAINMNRAGSAQCHAAAELRPYVIEFIANHPEQRSISVEINDDVLTVYADVHGLI